MAPAKRTLAAIEDTESPPAPVKKGRGRPKKRDATTPSAAPTAKDDGNLAEPRKSGRPKKSVLEVAPTAAKSTKGRKPKSTKATAKSSEESGSEKERKNSTVSIEVEKIRKEKKPKAAPETSTKKAFKEQGSSEADDANEVEERPWYWLMKAEPESRIEKGHDVKFSIDDLKNATEPEGWDGVRNYVAKNNMRDMKQGELAFFYHSNCKVPGIAGIMEIVQEASTDKSAHNPNHPYYDPKDDPENPKWSIVRVEFRQKFPRLISLKTLQSFAKQGGVLENLQTLKTTRLSVSKVTKVQWDFILGLGDMVNKEVEADAAGPSKAATKKPAGKKDTAKKSAKEVTDEDQEE